MSLKRVIGKQKTHIFSKYKGTFYRYCHCCHKFGHKVDDCRIKEEDQGLKKKEDTNISNRKILIICFICHNIGHFARHCKNSTFRPSKETHKKVWKMKIKKQINEKPVSIIPHGKMRRRKENSKYVE